jgi:membrane protein
VTPAVLLSWRDRYRGSPLDDFVKRLNAIEFGNQIILLGAAFLLSVLPLILLLGSLTSRRIDNDIAERLGLNRAAARAVDGLISNSSARFSLGIVVALLISLAGTIAVARSVQGIYERAFEQPRQTGLGPFTRSVVWVVAVAALLFIDTLSTRAIRDAPAGGVLLGLENLALFTLFFWWSIHFLLAGALRWRQTFWAALTTGVFWIGLGVVAALYFSSSILSDRHLYGSIGVVFTLATWFIAMSAVILLGAAVGAVIAQRRTLHGRPVPANGPG